MNANISLIQIRNVRKQRIYAIFHQIGKQTLNFTCKWFDGGTIMNFENYKPKNFFVTRARAGYKKHSNSLGGGTYMHIDINE